MGNRENNIIYDNKNNNLTPSPLSEEYPDVPHLKFPFSWFYPHYVEGSNQDGQHC